MKLPECMSIDTGPEDLADKYLPDELRLMVEARRSVLARFRRQAAPASVIRFQRQLLRVAELAVWLKDAT